MPVIEQSKYQPPLFFSNPHIQTIYPALFRSSFLPTAANERLTTPDDDFIDLEWLRFGNRKLVILSHGLEGSAQAKYMRGMASAFLAASWDVLLWNFRGRSGKPNLKPYSYHSGASHDLRLVINHALSKSIYSKLSLVGFSVGGNITLKYLAEEGALLSPLICAAVCLSTPCDLKSSSERLAESGNKIYMRRFLRSLHETLSIKAKMFPKLISLTGFEEIKTFLEYDNRYTAPLNGFRDAFHYWSESSSLPKLGLIKRPVLLLNALDDPFLAKESFPFTAAKEHGYLSLETPIHGGHVGFVQFNKRGRYWSELEALRFIETEASAE